MTNRALTAPYQPFYCEENVWQLCQRDEFRHEDVYAVFISNAARTCALWSQRASGSSTTPVVWDYHVILLDTSTQPAQIWDLDTRLGAPLRAERWWQVTFPLGAAVPDALTPRFRLVPAPVYAERFSSNRAHMRDTAGNYQAPPPPWPPIFDPATGTNLHRFIDMTDDFLGDVLDAPHFHARITT